MGVGGAVRGRVRLAARATPILARLRRQQLLALGMEQVLRGTPLIYTF